MPSVYKIHPAIGIIRVGESDAIFIGPEQIDHRGVELQPDGSETPITNFKSGGRIKRQAARFRVWEYEAAADGSLTPRGEVGADVDVEWTVSLVNSKAAGNKLVAVTDGSRQVLVPSGAPRNASIADRESLIIRGGSRTLSGPGSPVQRFDAGSFLGHRVDLGEATTDARGRLIVAGGRGISRGIPAAPGGPIPSLDYFHNNDRWHDDVSDGPITARVTAPGQAPVDALPAWVICAPPDFAPAAHGPATLYDIAVQTAIARGWKSEPAMPSFAAHIMPILKRALSLRWVHDWQAWNGITDDWPSLADLTNHIARKTAFDAIRDTTLLQYALPAYLMNMLVKWRDGNFISDLGLPLPTPTGAEVLDRASLEACIATSFYPGIEAGFTLANSILYAEFGRLSHALVTAGQVSAQMALPWQADFNDCDTDWWPSQRPNDVYASVASIPDAPSSWAAGVFTGGTSASRLRMVADFGKLGFIVRDAAGNLLEAERDASLPPR